jgi:hypothetical protein
VGLSTPAKITGQILSFCAHHEFQRPEYVKVEPVAGAEIDQCFFNVDEHVKNTDGKATNGWTIWIWPKVFIEAEHHCVWEKDDGELQDITPKRDGEETILFVRDRNAVFDWSGRTTKINKKRNISGKKFVSKYLTLTSQRQKIISENSSFVGRDRMSNIDPIALYEIEGELSKLSLKMNRLK